MYDPNEYICLEAELIVALEFYRYCIENVDIAIAFIPEEPC